jgi:predicted dehydrogenase
MEAVLNTIKAVLVGCGAMSSAWLEAAARINDLEMVGLVDLREEAARARQAEFNLHHTQVGTNLAAMLNTVKPDVLFDCTIPEAHHDNALLAFQHGVHVLGEKPLAHSMDAARAMVNAAQAAGLMHAIIQNRRFDPNIRRVRRYLESDQIGPVTTVNADFYVGAHFGGFRETMKHPLLIDMAIHTFDATRLITNADPVSVYAHEYNPRGSWYAHGSSAMCLFEMSDGSIFNYRGSWSAEGFRTTWESDWRIIGTRGTMRWDGADHPRVSVVDVPGRSAPGGNPTAFHSSTREFELPTLDPHDLIGGHEGVIRDFLSCVRSGGMPETVSSDNIKSLAMVFAAIDSAQTGRRVPVRWD